MITRQTSLVMGAILVAFMAAGSSAIAADQPPKLRLSEVQDIQPVSYRAELTLDPTKDDFTGSISIRMDVKKPAQTIWLEQEKITIRSASMTAAGKTMTAKTLPGGEDFVGFQFDSPVPAGPAEFKIEYSGVVITKNSSAIFRQQDNGNWYIFSQFEPTDARGAFPCFLVERFLASMNRRTRHPGSLPCTFRLRTTRSVTPIPARTRSTAEPEPWCFMKRSRCLAILLPLASDHSNTCLRVLQQ